jgi:hypothetical protein
LNINPSLCCSNFLLSGQILPFSGPDRLMHHGP